jgi:general secretion pathway protein F
MRNFTYQALTKEEELRTGEIVAKSAAAALEELESQGLSVLLIRQVEGPTPTAVHGRQVALQETTAEHLLRERVAQLLEKRDILAPALKAFAEELPQGPARRDLMNLAGQIQNGASVEELTQPPTLTKIWLPLVGNGSSFGTEHLQNVFAEAERDYANRAQLTRNLAYPTIIFLLSLGILLFLGIFVVPTFSDIFDDFDIALPWITFMLVQFSRILLFRPVQFLFVIAAIAFIAYVILLLFRRWLFPSRWLGMFLDGNSPQVAEMALFVRRLAEALNVGVPLPDALQLVGSSSNHRWLRREALRLSNTLASGADNRTALKKSALPATVTYALQAGPQSLPHVGLLQSIADGYFERVRNRFKWSTGFLPQLAILSVGIVVLTVVLALYLPLVMLIDGLSG